MNLTTTLTRRKQRPARRGPEPRPRPAAPATTQVRARRAGLPTQDRALYSCECGFAWHAEVTASPGCPHCGTPQAW